MPVDSRLVVRLAHETRSLAVESRHTGLSLSDLLRRAGLPLNTRCGQKGLCDGCLVELAGGSLIHTASGREVTASGTPLSLRAFEHRLADRGAEIHVPVRSLLAHEPQVVTSFRVNVTRAHDPLWQKARVTAAELAPDLPLADAIARCVAREQEDPVPVRPHRELARVGNAVQTSGQVAVEYLGDHWLVRPLALPRGRTAYGAAVDIGTTTVVVALVDLRSGDIVSTASELNAQASLGDNVVTRINRCLSDKAMLRELQSAVVAKTLAPLLAEVLAEASAAAEQLTVLTVAGNTTMLHLLAGVDPSPIGVAPFTPQFLEHRVLRLSELPLPEPWIGNQSPTGMAESPASTVSHSAADPPDPAIHLLPGAAAYIGADITSGIFSTGMAYRADTCLLVDIGTNGEIVLKRGDRMLGCATAAGPAFEGAGLKSGLRAGRGAISHVRLAPDTFQAHYELIGDGKPIGLCGTAYVDFIGQARRVGLLTPTGRFAAARRNHDCFIAGKYGPEFLVARGRGQEPIVISEPDIASLLQAKAAVAAGIVTLLERMQLTSADVDTLFLAGGFGFHMDIGNLLACGMLPGFRPEQIQVVGNTSLGGAYLALLDVGVLEAIKHVSAHLECVELNLEPTFESHFIDQLTLP